jgi:1,4-alpha-glucan branching enzyme
MKRYLQLLSFFAAATGLLAADESATTFSYTDPVATTVEVAGEFSNWKILPMTKDAAGTWSKTLYLKPGQYGYKFIINGEWKLDPKNPVRKTVNDIENSAVTVGTSATPTPSGSSATLTFKDAAAKTVHVAGEFNQWLNATDGKIVPQSQWLMQNDGAGNWTFAVTLPPGRYKFKYVIDSGERWAQDPNLTANDDGNSILEIKGTGASAGTTSGTTFTFADPTAKAVFLAGQFNNWSATANALKKDDGGLWTITIPLKPGKQPYKFVVDGDWRLDPTNPDTLEDSDGNKNSVKTIAP